MIAEQEAAQLAPQFVPASADQRAAILYRLQGHYYQQGMSESLIRAVAGDYARLLDSYPASVLQAAADECLLDPERKFFPKVGELKHICVRIHGRKSARYAKLLRLIELSQHQGA